MSVRQGKVECPRCHKIWTLMWASPGVMCDCHLFCSEGDKASDCTVTEYNYTGQLGWPEGVHTNAENEGDDVLNRTGYCSTHNKYVYKVPIWLEVNWKEWERERAPEKLRMFRK